jgi:hypothetical protein
MELLQRRNQLCKGILIHTRSHSRDDARRNLQPTAMHKMTVSPPPICVELKRAMVFLPAECVRQTTAYGGGLGKRDSASTRLDCGVLPRCRYGVGYLLI